MALHSQLFSGDGRLEAAAVSDSAHITIGSRGDYVVKIQIALIRLDDADIKADGVYGPLTAAAVLAYKKKRNIVNRSYQSSADDIVGRMTIATLDDELCKWTPEEPIELRVIAPQPDRMDHRPHLITKASHGGPMLAFSFSPALFGPPSFNPGPIVSINKGQTALIEVKNGTGASITSGDPKIASIRDPTTRGPVTKISSDPQTIEVCGNHRGGAVIIADLAAAPTISLPRSMFVASMTVSVKEPRSTPYVPTMTPHNHRPTRRWSDLLKAIEQPTSSTSGAALYALCAVGADPMTFVNAAIAGEFTNKPIARKHLDWYLTDGRGQEFNEDDYIESWVKSDSAIRNKVAQFVLDNAARGMHYSGFFPFTQNEYIDQDYRFAFGTLDRIDIEVDWVVKTVKLWFMDSYEWHPVCAGFYTKFPDDVVRDTNSLHAALVEMKDRGAADYWMVGEATLPLSAFGFPP